MSKIIKKVIRYILYTVVMIAAATLGAYLASLIRPDIRTEGKMLYMIVGTLLGGVLNQVHNYVKEKRKDD